MRATMLYGPGDVRYESVPEPEILQPTDAIIRLSATCICGSDLWPYRGLQEISAPQAMGHEYCGIVEAVGSAVTRVKPGPVRRRFLLYFRQHLPPLPVRFSVLVREPRVHDRRTGPPGTRASGRWNAGGHR